MKYIIEYYKVLTSLIVFVIYLLTMAPTVVHLDAGELATVQVTLGIAHPTGYPLFTIAGFLFSKLFFFLSPILALNLLAALYCTGSLYFSLKTIELILNNIEIRAKKGTVAKLSPEIIPIVSSAVGLCIAFSETFWLQSTSTEVYSLHLFLLSLILFAALQAYFSKQNRYWYYTAFILALGFSNHMTTILLLPGIAFLFYNVNGFTKRSMVLNLKMILAFIPIVFINYIYLPLRGINDPTLNWGNPINFENILRHVSGKQYQVWIFSSFEAAEKQFSYFIKSLPQEFAYVGLLVGVLGLPFLFRLNKSITIFFIINFIATIIYSINYDIVDIDSYFLLAYISLIFFSIGFFVFSLKKLKPTFQPVIYAIPIFLLLFNFNRVDQSEVYTFEDYPKAVLQNVDEGSVVFSYLWDYFISPSYYFQYVEEFRKDINVIDKELLRRSWYFDQLESNMPQVVDGASEEIKKFLDSLEPFEKGEEFEPNIIEANFRAMMTRLVATNVEERSFYITPELFENEFQNGQFSLPPGYTIVPKGLVFQVVPQNFGYVENTPLESTIRFNKPDDHYQQQVKRLVTQMLIYRIMYEIQYKHMEKAKTLYKELKTDFPDITIPPAVTNLIGGK